MKQCKRGQRARQDPSLRMLLWWIQTKRVVYEWLPLKCDHCRMFGHTQDSCRKKEQHKKEWRVKNNTSTQNSQPQVHIPTQQIADAEKGEEYDFQRVTRGNTEGHPPHTQQNNIRMDCTIPIANSFQTLLEREQVGLIGFIETKVQLQKVDYVMRKICNQWQWDHNATHTERGRIIPKSSFQFRDMWAKDEIFKAIILNSMQHQKSHTCLGALKAMLCKLRHLLKQWNRTRYADIYAQQAKAREELTTIQTQLHRDPVNGDPLQKEIKCRDHYVSITHSAISLLKQQGKADWIAYGDECSRFFMSRIKQRKAMTYIYTLRDHMTNG
ncbi:LOW QUALITY PROTEIN: hypothetical protein Cgig2_023621 [Carnegiea gigantea]|uniref:Uncharacterized protein n=1 Tax=Carnegiea gigantea TaxID=171969 RepID=A0A9Q1QIE8_9CARY|nr:LOW QUALITY PROTEIN: hypothetical protein Cgig2_023621 [Carnegiea gigantea]